MTLKQTAAEALAHVAALEDKMNDPQYAERVRQSYERAVRELGPDWRRV